MPGTGGPTPAPGVGLEPGAGKPAPSGGKPSPGKASLGNPSLGNPSLGNPSDGKESEKKSAGKASEKLSPKDSPASAKESPPASEDYVNDPRRSKSALRPLVHAARTGVAFEAETSPVMLRTFVTPNHAFYVRNHAPVPEAGNAAEMPLQVGDKTANYLDLLEKHGKATLISTIQCTGNRLGEVAEAMGKDSYFEAAPSGIGLISNAEWGGVRLADVLKEEVEKKWKGREDNLHVEFTGEKTIIGKDIANTTRNFHQTNALTKSPLRILSLP